MAGKGGNRTHPGRYERPAKGFEGLGGHQTPSIPAKNSFMNEASYSERPPGAICPGPCYREAPIATSSIPT